MLILMLPLDCAMFDANSELTMSIIILPCTYSKATVEH